VKYTNKTSQSSRKRTKSKAESTNDSIRLNKYIADAGYASRRKADELIASGVVKVNRKIVTELGTKIKPNDNVTIKGDPIYVSHHYVYILLNKPKNYITSTNDEFGRKTVMELIKVEQRIFPVGRLDRNTTGVLLLTNDGELAQCLTHPKYQIIRTYNAKLDKPLRTDDAKSIAAGLEIDEGIFSSPCELLIDPNDRYKVTITLTEGKNHEIKKMFEVMGYEVKSLDRKYFYNLSTKGLKRGEHRFLEKAEIAELRKLINKK
jgi:23S rRNA pseudouridine2605 synthase